MFAHKHQSSKENKKQHQISAYSWAAASMTAGRQRLGTEIAEVTFLNRHGTLALAFLSPKSP